MLSCDVLRHCVCVCYVLRHCVWYAILFCVCCVLCVLCAVLVMSVLMSGGNPAITGCSLGRLVAFDGLILDETLLSKDEGSHRTQASIQMELCTDKTLLGTVDVCENETLVSMLDFSGREARPRRVEVSAQKTALPHQHRRV